MWASMVFQSTFFEDLLLTFCYRCHEQHPCSQVSCMCTVEYITTILSRRASIETRVAKEKGFSLIFLESICDDPAILAANVALKISSGDPDYKDTSPEVAEKDFLRRIQEYEKIYETITEPHLSYLRIVNVGSSVTLNRINGYLQSRIAFYLMNLHVKPRSIYLSRVRFTIIFMMHPIDCCFSMVKASIT